MCCNCIYIFYSKDVDTKIGEVKESYLLCGYYRTHKMYFRCSNCSECRRNVLQNRTAALSRPSGCLSQLHEAKFYTRWTQAMCTFIYYQITSKARYYYTVFES